MTESRCGLVCSQCTWKESTGCPGCLQQEKPFWGTCPIKTCCEGRRLPHCGGCPEFPCQPLHDYAYDKEHGEGDGSRLEQCRRWQRAATPSYRTVLMAVTDMDRAKAFYTGVLGLNIVEDIGANVTLEGGVTLQQMEVWKMLLDGRPVTPRHHAAELYFEVQDMDGFAARLAGVEFCQPMHEEPWGQRLLRLYDPDGNLIEVGEDMAVVTRRFLESGLTPEQTAARMGVPLEYVRHYGDLT